MNAFIKKKGIVYQKIEPYKDIIWFLFLFIVLEFAWKLCINEGDNNGRFLVLGKDFSQIIRPACIWVANITHWIIVNIFGHNDFNIDGVVIFFDNSLRFRIIWECTGIRQMIIFTILLLLYFGPLKKKFWYILFSILVLSVINIVRIVATALITKGGFPEWFITFNEWYNNRQWDDTDATYWMFCRDWFELFHRDVFRWLYYNGVVFLLWLLWEEVFNLPYQKFKKNKELPQ